MKKIYYYITPIILFGGILLSYILALPTKPNFNPFDYFISHLGFRYVTDFVYVFNGTIIIGGISFVIFSIKTYKLYNILHLFLFSSCGILLIFVGFISFDVSVYLHGWFAIPMFLCMMLGQTNFWYLTLKKYNKSISCKFFALYSSITGLLLLIFHSSIFEWIYFISLIPFFYFIQK